MSFNDMNFDDNKSRRRWDIKHWKMSGWQDLTDEEQEIKIIDAIVSVLDVIHGELWTCPIAKLEEIVEHCKVFHELTSDNDYLFVLEFCENLIVERFLTGDADKLS